LVFEGRLLAEAKQHGFEGEGDFRGSDAVAEGSFGKWVAVVNSTCEQACRVVLRSFFLGKRAQGEADFAVVGGDEPGDQVPVFVWNVAYSGLQDGEGGGEFVAESVAVVGVAFEFVVFPIQLSLVGSFANGEMALRFCRGASVGGDFDLEGGMIFAEVVPAGGMSERFARVVQA
jgi:hypothetical protein